MYSNANERFCGDTPTPRCDVKIRINKSSANLQIMKMTSKHQRQNGRPAKRMIKINKSIDLSFHKINAHREQTSKTQRGRKFDNKFTAVLMELF